VFTIVVVLRKGLAGVGKGVREALISIVKEKGFSVFDNPRELESLLVNLCNDHKNEVSAILPAIREKFSDRLVEAAKTKSLSLAISDLIIILCKDYALSSEAAKWAVESLAVSLDLESEREPKNSISKDNSLRKVESEKKTTNGDYLILVMSGSFVMGNTLDNVDHVSANDEAKGDLKRQKPPHKVNLTYDFYIGRFPVTFEEYDRFCEELGIEKPNDQGWGRGKRPVIDVTWYEAIAYCNWLSDKEDIPRAYDNGGNLLNENGSVTNDPSLVVGYRLPSEAEWEYAARGGKKSVGFRYSGGNDVDRVAWFIANSCRRYNPKKLERALLSGKTNEVGLKAANELGLNDMSGNVWEWCSDWAAKYKAIPRINPYESKGTFKVTRGGCWGSTKAGVTVSKRGGDLPTNRSQSLGFRICKTLILESFQS